MAWLWEGYQNQAHSGHGTGTEPGEQEMFTAFSLDIPGFWPCPVRNSAGEITINYLLEKGIYGGIELSLSPLALFLWGSYEAIDVG